MQQNMQGYLIRSETARPKRIQPTPGLVPSTRLGLSGLSGRRPGL